MKLKYFIRSTWVIPALRVALVVGSILFAINHGKALLEGQMDLGRWISAALSYFVPYCVYIVGKASNLQANPEEEH